MNSFTGELAEKSTNPTQTPPAWRRVLSQVKAILSAPLKWESSHRDDPNRYLDGESFHRQWKNRQDLRGFNHWGLW